MIVMQTFRERWQAIENRLDGCKGYTALNMRAAYFGGGAAMASVYFREDESSRQLSVHHVIEAATRMAELVADGKSLSRVLDFSGGLFAGGWGAFSTDVENAGIPADSPEGENLCLVFYAGGATMAGVIHDLGIRKSQLVVVSAECVIEMRRTADRVKAMMKQGGHA